MHVRVICRWVPFVAGLLACAGCESGLSHAWWNAWIDPTAVGNYRDNVVNDIQRSISFRDTPVGIVGAEDPTPDDLVADIEEYVIGPGDALQVSLLDFVQLGAESNLSLTVDELGYIDLPQLGRIRAEGRTAYELKGDLIQKAKAAGIYHPEEEPTVVVNVVNPLQRMFNLSGQVLYPGPYRIPRPDFRLREAINLGGGMDDTIKSVWVMRGAAPTRRAEPTGDLSAPEQLGEPTEPSAPPLPPPPVAPVLMSSMEGSAGSPANGAPPEPQAGTRPAAGLALPSDDVPTDLIEAVEPPKGPGATQPDAPRPAQPERPVSPPPAGPPANPGTADRQPGTGDGLPTYKFVNDAFIEVPPDAPSAPEAAPSTPMDAGQPGEPEPPAPPPPPAPGEPPVDWEALASEAHYRIIRVPADKLRNGDPNYNIVIKHDDWIRVDPGPVGLYYMAGNVVRPGPYALAGEQITLTQALAAAGGLDPLAWPTRCSIRRRLDGDRDEITQWDLARIVEGKDPDIYLKPHDVVRVGTHAIAPLLATIRNSFRFTYGFGFVYDRNFADIDAFGPQANPNDRRRVERQQLFGNLFQ